MFADLLATAAFYLSLVDATFQTFLITKCLFHPPRLPVLRARHCSQNVWSLPALPRNIQVRLRAILQELDLQEKSPFLILQRNAFSRDIIDNVGPSFRPAENSGVTLVQNLADCRQWLTHVRNLKT